MSVELRRLRTFVTIAEQGGFTAAGNALGLTQSAISNQMRALEDDLGLELFDRTRRPPVLNAHGIGILAGAKAILQSYAELVIRGRGLSRPTGLVRIASAATPLIRMIPSVLKRLAEEAPLVRAIVITGMSKDICHRVINGDVDCGLVTDLGALPQGLACTPVRQDRLITIVPATSPAADLREALDLHPFIQVSQKTWVRHLIDQRLAEDEMEPSAQFELDSFEAIIEMVRCGVGCAVVSADALAVLAADVRSLDFGGAPVARTIAFVERASNVAQASVAIIRESVIALFSEPGKAV
jgi:DNA-binding transcriptional LysR family regulator